MNYRYTGYTTTEKKMVNGAVSGDSEAAVRELLLIQGCQAISVKQLTNLPPLENMFPSLFKIKPKEITMFSRQLATLLDAGISIVPALQLIQENMTGRMFRKMITEMLTDLRSGNSFSDALLKHKVVFGELYCQLVAVGERTGVAADSLKKAAEYLEKDILIKKKIKKALTYPAIVLSVAVVVIGVLMVFVMPSMTKMFVDMNIELPLTTRLLIGFSDFITANKLPLLGGIVLTVVLFVLYRRSYSGRCQLDRLLLKIPVIGGANLMGEMARFSQTLALLVHAGLPLPEIMEMVRRLSGNQVVKDALAGVHTGLLEGEGLSGPMSRNRLFPSLLVQMVRVGEESGKLESTLSTIAGSYEAEADDKISGMISMIEPVMTIGLALIIGFIALSVITPMYSMTGKFG
jgi:type IV pilus assembly protein PilC